MNGGSHPETTPMTAIDRTSQRYVPSTSIGDGAPPSQLPELRRGATGASVRALQRALLEQGQKLPRFGVDGRFGRETETALRAFQAAQGLTPSGRLDARTRTALEAPVDTRTPDVRALASDGVLHAVMAVGFDEQDSDLWTSSQARAGLLARGFVPLRVSGMDDAALARLGIPPGAVDPRSTYFTRELELSGKKVRALVQFVDRASEAPRAEFEHGLTHAELVLYGGHARYGSGPDFDAKTDNAGNVVLGTAYDAQMREQLRGEPNALRRLKLPGSYQLMLFAGCRTRDYLDELRSIPRNKGTDNLDLVLSEDLLYWTDIPQTLLGALDAVVAGEDVAALRARLSRLNGGVPFRLDGFQDNPVPRS
jgi:hypothetical protein